MIECPKCGRAVDDGTFICPGCEFILDASFLGDDITDDERGLRQHPRGEAEQAAVNKTVDFGEDAMILGNPREAEWSDFGSRDAGVSQRELTQARFYVGGATAALLQPDAVPDVVPDAFASSLRITPFERHVLDFINGKRSIGRIQKKAGMEESEFKTSVAMLADKGVIRLRTTKKKKRRHGPGSDLSMASMSRSDRARPPPPPPVALMQQQTAIAAVPLSDAGGGGSKLTEQARVRPKESHADNRADAERGGAKGALARAPFRSLRADAAPLDGDSGADAPARGESASGAARARQPSSTHSNVFARAQLERSQRKSLTAEHEGGMPSDPGLLPGVPLDDDDDLLFEAPTDRAKALHTSATKRLKQPRTSDRPRTGSLDLLRDPTGMGDVQEASDLGAYAEADAAALDEDASTARPHLKPSRYVDVHNARTGSTSPIESRSAPNAPDVPQESSSDRMAISESDLALSEEASRDAARRSDRDQDVLIDPDADDEGADARSNGDVDADDVDGDDNDLGSDFDVNVATAAVNEAISRQQTASLPSLQSDINAQADSADDGPLPMSPTVPIASPNAPQNAANQGFAVPLMGIPGQGLIMSGQAPVALPGAGVAPPLPRAAALAPEVAPDFSPSAALPQVASAMVPEANVSPAAAALRPALGVLKPGTGRPSAQSSVGFEQARKAEKIFDQAQKDLAAGKVSSARMNAKLATQFDPSVQQYKDFLAVLDADHAGKPVVAVKHREVVLFEDANVAEGRGDYEKAVKLLSEAISINPKAAALHNRLGVVLSIRLKRHEEALVYLRKAIELDQASLVYMNNFSKVTAMLESALEKDPDAMRKKGKADGEKVAVKKIRPKLF